jgi:general secretion pathway protein G
MSKQTMQRMRHPRAIRSGGFTLLEMLAVIVLIGIIGTIVYTQVGKSLDKGKYGAGKAQLTAIDTAIQRYAMDNGSAPPNLDALVTKPSGASDWLGPYLKAKQLKDPWGHAFGYKVPGDHGDYDVIFYGHDGRPGGSGMNKDVGNWE